MSALLERKARLRAASRQARAERPVQPEAGARLADCFGRAIAPPAGCAVSAFWPLPDEIDVRPLMRHLAEAGHALALPVVVARGQPLVFRRWRSDDRLEPGPMGTAHPPATAPEVVPEVLLVPLLAFDRGGRRLGYGGGYYDRTLARLRRQGPVLAVGVAFADQEVACVPTGPCDAPLDWVVTEEEAIRIGAVT